jgi:hypothetical protein
LNTAVKTVLTMFRTVNSFNRFNKHYFGIGKPSVIYAVRGIIMAMQSSIVTSTKHHAIAMARLRTQYIKRHKAPSRATCDRMNIQYG